ncbi:MAG: 2,3,4,5-tetrahydropyridine-2,6-dicarboxylate N-succinyltransferase, partial [Bacteroidales bacterium]|nr:2,3,4,5-tetrahydropyridine-2,6-dicarboxylate N-succinyltransferase [Bacteroidales bacterium]
MYTIHQTVIQEAWGNRVLLKDVDVQKSIRFIIDELDAGKLRVAEPGPDGWKVNDWIK